MIFCFDDHEIICGWNINFSRRRGVCRALRLIKLTGENKSCFQLKFIIGYLTGFSSEGPMVATVNVSGV